MLFNISPRLSYLTVYVVVTDVEKLRVLLQLNASLSFILNLLEISGVYKGTWKTGSCNDKKLFVGEVE